MLVLGCSEEQSRKAGNSGSPGYRFLTALGKKHFAVVGLLSHHSGCIETNPKKADTQSVEKRVSAAPQEEIMKKQNESLC